MTAASTVTPLPQRTKRTSAARALARDTSPRNQRQAHTDPLPLAHQLRTSTSVYAPEQMPLPIPVPRTLLPAPIERGTVSTGELRHRSGRFMQTVAEVLAGIRPPRQLSPWLTREVHSELSSFVNEKFRRQAGNTRKRAQVVSVHVFMVDEDTAEIAARMVVAGRSHAIAARLQHVHDPRERSVWRCTSLAWA